MVKAKIARSRMISVILISAGIVLGVNWNAVGAVLGVNGSNEAFCIGDHIFIALGLPAWSNGMTGIHYPGIIGAAFILVGLALLNSTKKE